MATKVLNKISEVTAKRLSAFTQFLTGNLNESSFEEIAGCRFPRLLEKHFPKKTQTELADILGVSYGAVQMWQNKKAIPELVHFISLVDYSGLSADELIDFLFAREKPIPVGGDDEEERVEAISQIIPTISPRNLLKLSTLATEHLYGYNPIVKLQENKESTTRRLSRVEIQRLRILFKESLETSGIEKEEVVLAGATRETVNYFLNCSEETEDFLGFEKSDLQIISSFCCQLRGWIIAENGQLIPRLNCRNTYKEIEEMLRDLVSIG